MIKAGLRDVNQNFSKYMKMVRGGREVLITDRGRPVAVIKPIAEDALSPEERIRLLEDEGTLRKALPGQLTLKRPVSATQSKGQGKAR